MTDARAVLERGLPAGISVDTVAAIVLRIAAAGRAAWPGIELADAVIAARIAARLRDEAAPADDADAVSEALAELVGGPHHDADVFLATALVAREPTALQLFEAQLVPQLHAALRRIRLSASQIDEVLQVLRVELLVGDGARAPKLADYAGRGELVGWLRVTATRKALSLLRKTSREDALDELLLDHWPDGAADAGTQHLRATYTAELKKAIREAFAVLEVRQRNLLRQHILDELTIDDLARLYRAHRATCARWLAEARAELGKHTRKRLVAALGVDRDELESLLRVLDSDIELSISRILHDAQAAAR